MKLFKTSDMEIVKYCQSVFNFVIPSVQIAQKSEKFVEVFKRYAVYKLYINLHSFTAVANCYVF